ncbi:MAG TPA: site-specific integrase [Candidatus Binataceae bacterium]|nr:site-specific integrase [Candidatus Binataceae bacterium]
MSSWRLSEMRGLAWSEVQLAEPRAFKTDPSQIVLRADRSKNGRARILPLRGELRAILMRALARRSPHTDLVFHHRHRPLADFRRAWRSACARAGVPGLLIHDLRRSAIRNFVRAGVRESVAMALSGHRTRAVFDRYSITDTADLVAAVEATGRPI